jgi:A/G-specific adenine glycosylase
MLQQTQVSRVLEYWPRFLARYPTVRRLARARPAAVREAWNGLGYYRRAANLHRLAKVVVREYGGRLPDDPAELEKLPGVGHYTAGAVACFAYERPAATVDTNVGRVLGRVFGVAGVTKLIALHHALQPRRGKSAWTFNQAVMELGALVCRARKPRCDICPVSGVCRWFAVSRSTQD